MFKFWNEKNKNLCQTNTAPLWFIRNRRNEKVFVNKETPGQVVIKRARWQVEKHDKMPSKSIEPSVTQILRICKSGKIHF